MKELSEEAKICIAMSQHALSVVLTGECAGCGVNEGLPKHPCPYKEDIDGDNETMCNCCDRCIGVCSDEI